MSSRNQKAAAARAQAQAQIRSQERRTTALIVAGSLVAIALFAALVVFIVNQGKVEPLSSADAIKPAGSDATGGIPVGTAGVVGEDVPTDAARVDLYIDFMCPICNTFEQVNAEDLDAMREEGLIELYYHPISILDRASSGTQFSTRAAAAAGVVADQAPDAFLDFVEGMFASQPEEGSEGLTDEQISQIAIDAGVSEDVAGTLANADYRKWATAATDQSRIDGVTGTPSLRVSASGEFADGEVLNSSDTAPSVDYFTAGNLRTYIEGL